jgi:ribosomal protein L29
MKTREKDAKRNLSVAELEAELRATREKQFKIAFKHKAMPVTNTAEIKTLRRHIARLQTWIREKQATKQ